MSRFVNDSIFWVEVEKIQPNPFQPRKEFDEGKLRDLADSIRQYGILQPLVVTRHETMHEDGSMTSTYELIAGERRLRASKIAGLSQVPVTIRTSEESDKEKLELAIIENLQREDLNPMDRAKAFKRLASEFGLSHGEIGKKIGKSREYVSNTIRLLLLPEDMQQSLAERKITEGHTRPLLMLSDRPDEQTTLFREILMKRLSVRDAEQIARHIAVDRARKKPLTPELLLIERELSTRFGTRVRIEKKEEGGRVLIDFFTADDLEGILAKLKAEQEANRVAAESAFVDAGTEPSEAERAEDDRSQEEIEQSDEELYSVRNFTI